MIALLCSFQVFTQTTKGTDFWLNFLYNLSAEDMYVIVSADDGAQVNIELPAQNVSYPLTLNAGELKRQLISSAYATNSGDTLTEFAIHVTSDKEISVYANSIAPATSDATCVIPSQSIPSQPNFMINALDSNGPTSKARNNVFSIVPHDSGTMVEITPKSATTSGRPANVPYTKSLQKGQAYIVRAQSGFDLQGSTVRVLSSDKKVSVFQGNDCIRVNCGACDHLYEVVLPNKTLGKNFVLTPFYDAGNGYRFSVISPKNNCVVSRNGLIVDTLNAGEQYSEYMPKDSSLCITTSEPASITQTMIGCNPNYTGDPATVAILPLEQSITSAIVSTANTTIIRDHFINVLVPKTGIQRFFLDGVKVPQANFTQVYCGDFYFYSDTVSPGSHSIECIDGFNTLVYGMGGFESYAYFAGASLKNLELSFEVEIVPNCDTGILAKFIPIPDTLDRYKWKFPPGAIPDNDTFVTPVVYFPTLGEYNVQVAGFTPETGWDSTEQKVFIEDTTAKDFIEFRDAIICEDSFTFELPGATAYDFTWNTGDTGAVLTITKGGRYIVTGQNKFTNCSISDTANVVMHDKVNVDFGFHMDRFCPGYPLELYDSTKVTNDTIAKWEWLADFQLFSNKQNDTIKSPRANNYDIRLRITTNKGCVDSLERRIEVDDNPVAKMSLIIKDSCVGRGLTQGQNSSYILLGKLDRFVWEYSTGDTITGTNAPIKEFKDTGLYWARILAESQGGCVDTSARTYFRIYPAPQPQATLIDSAVCKDNNFFLFDNQTVENEPLFYAWQWGDGSGSVLTNPPAKVYSDTGNFELNLIAGFQSTGCTDTFKRINQVFEKPEAKLILNGRDECLNNNYFNYQDNSDAKGAPLAFYEWLWSDGTRDSGMSQIIKSYATDGSFNLRYVFSSGKGCSDTLSRNQNVYQSPEAKFVLDSIQLCKSNNQIKAVDSSKGPANIRYNWDFGNGNTYTIKNPPLQQYADSGSYTIELIVIDPLVLCRDTFTEEITILEDPIAKASVNEPIQCAVGNSFTFTDTASQKAQNLEYSWIFPGPDTLSGQQVTNQFNAPGVYTIISRVNNGPLCSDTSSIQVVVGDTSISTLWLSKSSSCISENSIQAKVQQISGPALNAWSWNNNWTETTDSISKTLNVGITSITAFVENIYGCKDTISEDVEIWPLPTFTLLNNTSDNQCLKNNNYSFEANNLTGASPYTYFWRIDQQVIASGSTLNYSYNNAQLDSVRLIVEDGNGCQDSIKYGVEVFEQPVVTFEADSICPDEIFTIVSSIQPSGIDNLNYQWLLNGQAAGNDSTFRYENIVPNTSYTLELIVNTPNGCADTSNMQTLVVHDEPTAQIAFTALEPMTGRIPFEFRDSSIRSSQTQWLIEGKTFNEQKFTYNFANVGKQNIVLIAINEFGCSDSTHLVINVESPSRIFIPTAFSPNDNGLNESFGPEYLAPVKEYTFVIFNRWGEKIFETENPQDRWDGTYMGQPVMQGEYMYMINLLFQNGERLSKKGQVTLLK